MYIRMHILAIGVFGIMDERAAALVSPATVICRSDMIKKAVVAELDQERKQFAVFSLPVMTLEQQAREVPPQHFCTALEDR